MGREISPGFHWIQDCVASDSLTRNLRNGDYPWFDDGRRVHSSANAYLFVGEETLLFETLSPVGTEQVLAELEAYLNGRSLDYLVISHTDTPHCANTNEILEAYPDCTLLAPGIGQPDELYYLEDATVVDPGDTIDLGQFSVEFCEAYFMDAPKSIWMFEHQSETLFSSDWVSFLHTDNECLRFVDELAGGVSLERLHQFHNRVFFWFQYARLESVVEKIDHLIDTYAPATVAPAHGLVIREDAIRYLDTMKTVTQQVNEDGRVAVF